MALQRVLVLPKITFLDLFLFLFFFTLHADQLGGTLFGFTFRLNNLIGVLLLPFFLSKLYRLEKKILITTLLFSISLLISCLSGFCPGRSLIFFLWYLVTLALYFFLPLQMLHHSPRQVLTLYLASFVAVGLYASLQLLLSFFTLYDPFTTQWIFDQFVRPNAFAYEPSYYALYMTPFVMMANLKYLKEQNSSFLIFKHLGTKQILFINLLYVISTSTSCLFAYLFFFSATFCFHDLRKKVLRFMGYFSVVTLTGGVLFPSLFKHYFLKFFFHGFMTHHSFHERWMGICNAWKIFCEHPFFGVGLGAIPSYLLNAWSHQNNNFFYMPTEVELQDAPNPLKFFEPSNVFTEVLASTGIFGFIFLALLLGLLFRRMKRNFNHEWVLLFFVSSLVMMATLQFNQGIFRTYIWVHLSLGWGLASKIEHEENFC